MSQTPSAMLPLGTEAPRFELPDTEGRMVSIDDYAGRPLLVMFICNLCPYVKRIRTSLSSFAYEYTRRGLAIVAISSNDASQYPEDGPEEMKREVADSGYVFPYLFDETQEVAKAYHAACTPDFFLFDRKRNLVYRGQFDDSRPANDIPVTGASLRAAADAVIHSQPAPTDQRPSVGCNIKWKA